MDINLIKKGFVFGNYEVIKTPTQNSLSKKIEGAWIKHRVYDIRNWMTISRIESIYEKSNKSNLNK